jgi:NADH-quinone oxidoreductase subunit A
VLETFIPILLLMGFAAFVGIVVIGISYFIGPRLPTRRKLSTYESGMPLLDQSRKRISVKFFVIAMLFILFDVEIAFVYPWAVLFRFGAFPLFAEMMVFLAILGVGYVYAWKTGAFDW